MSIQPLHTLVDPWWLRQPDESLTHHTRFRAYRDQPVNDPDYQAAHGRSLERIATQFRVSDKSIAESATKHCWDDRVTAYDRHRLQRNLENIRGQLVSAELAAALDLVRMLRVSTSTHLERGTLLDPADLPAVADTVTALHRHAATLHHDPT